MFLGKLWVRVKGEFLSRKRDEEEVMVEPIKNTQYEGIVEKKNSPEKENPETGVASNPRSLGS